jgi:hypothetical protein
LSLPVTSYLWDGDCGVGAVAGNVWSRAARRKFQDLMNGDVKLGFRITVKNIEDSDMTSQVIIEWRIGTDVVLFQSFCGKLKTIVQHSERQT